MNTHSNLSGILFCSYMCTFFVNLSLWISKYTSIDCAVFRHYWKKFPKMKLVIYSEGFNLCFLIRSFSVLKFTLTKTYKYQFFYLSISFLIDCFFVFREFFRKEVWQDKEFEIPLIITTTPTLLLFQFHARTE